MTDDFGGLLDVAALEKWVGDKLPGAGEPLEVSQIQGGGASNEMFVLQRNGQRWVLRRPPKHPVSPTAHDMVREFRVLSALEGTPVPHATPLILCDDPEVVGARFYIMEFIDGFTPKDPLPAPFDADPSLHREFGTELVDGIAELSLVDWREVGLGDFGKPDGFLERQVNRWLGQLEKYKTRDIPGIDFVARWLDENRPEMGPPGIIHGDYQFINVMFHHGAPARLAAIVDWEQSTIGDPLLDLGWMLGGWQHPGEEPRFASVYFTTREGLPRRDELAERYAKKTGRPLDRLDYYVVLALFKLGCVLEGHYHKFLTGKSKLEVHEKMGPLVLRLIRQAEETARGGAI